MPSFNQLATRYELDEVGGAEGSAFAAEDRLARALDRIGWRAASDSPSEEVASSLALIVGACVHGHRNIETLKSDVAACLWQYAHHLDGSVAPREEWEPAAAHVIDLYVTAQDPTELR
jgi:hypothetical protein